MLGLLIGLLFSGSLIQGQTLVPQDDTGVTASPANVRHRLRIAWGGGAARIWIGSIEVRQGKILEVIPLGMHADGAANLLLDERLIIRQWLASTYNGCDLIIEASPTATLHLEMVDRDAAGPPWTDRLSVAEILQEGPISREIDGNRNRLLVYRHPADAIHIDFQRDNMVFRPKEPIRMQLQSTAPVMSANTDGFIRVQIREPNSRETLATKKIPIRADAQGKTGDIPTIEMPGLDREGVFNLEIDSVEIQKRGPFSNEVVRASRMVQYVAIAERAATPATGNQLWQELFLLDPARPDRWIFRKHPGQLKLPVRYPAPLGDGATTITLGGKGMVQLAPKGWQAYALPVDEPNRPHLLEIEYLSDQPMALGLSVLEPDVSGRIPVTGMDAGLFIPTSVVQTNEPSPADPPIQRHRVVFWPTSRQPYLAVANHDESNNAVFGRIRLLAGPDRLEPLPAGMPAATPRRSRMLLLQRPNIAKIFGAPATFDRAQNLTLDDWVTMYQAVDRLTQYMKANGYTGLILTVAADGSAIYPSRLLAPTPRLENGAFFESGQDPMRKDVVELICRMFDRCDLKVIPTIEFSGMLPTLEMARSKWQDPQIDLISDRGDFWKNPALESAAFRPPYNPLRPLVQQAMLSVIDELVDRYANHASFGGVGLVVNDHTILGIPGIEWGQDPLTLEQFRGDKDAPAARNVSTAGETNLSERWIDWRCWQMTRLMERCAQSVERGKPNAQLYLLPLDESIDSVIHAGSLAESTNPNQRSQRIRGWGFDLAALTQHRLITVLDTQAVGRWQTRPADSNSIPEWMSTSSTEGITFLHQSIWVEFEQLAHANLFGQSTGPILRLQQFAPAGPWSRRRYALGLARTDCPLVVDGGWNLPQGEESGASGMLDAFTRLPAQPFTIVAPKNPEAPRSITVRQCRDSNQLYFYGVNTTPWSIDAEFDLAIFDRQKIHALSKQDLSIRDNGDTTIVAVRLEPYDLFAAQLPAQAEIKDYRGTLPADATARMQQEILELKTKLAGAPAEQTNANVVNGDFEATASGTSPPAWQVDASGGLIALDPLQAHQGRQSLMMRNNQGIVRVVSQPIQAPKTGRISISFWVRWSPGAESLRISINGNYGSESIERTTSVHPAQASDPQNWQALTVHFNDLPGELTDVRVGFELADPTSIWIDQIELHDRWLDRDESQALKQMLNLAGFKLHEQGDVVGCLNILESYWPRFVDQFYGGPAAAESATLPANGQNQGATRR